MKSETKIEAQNTNVLVNPKWGQLWH
jgi:hypothetical protein